MHAKRFVFGQQTRHFAVGVLDIAERQGIRIDLAGLSQALGVPVVTTVAVRKRGLSDLLSQVDLLAGRHAAGVSVWQEPSAAEIRHGGDPRALCDQIGIAQLQRETRIRVRPMPQRLPVRTDRAYLGRIDLRAQQRLRGIGKAGADPRIQGADFIQRGGAVALRQFQDARTQLRRIRMRQRRAQMRRRIERTQRRVDAVRTGA